MHVIIKSNPQSINIYYSKMPHLVYCNYVWRISSDDFVLPSFCAILLRVLWTLLLVANLIVVFNLVKECSEGWIYILYLFGSIACNILAIISDICLLYHSLQGSMIEINKRKYVNIFLTCKLILGIITFLLLLFGLILLTDINGIPCDRQIEYSGNVYILILAVVVSQLINLFVLLCCFYMLSHKHINKIHELKDDEWAIQKWNKRVRKTTRSIQICTCNIFGGG